MLVTMAEPGIKNALTRNVYLRTAFIILVSCQSFSVAIPATQRYHTSAVPSVALNPATGKRMERVPEFKNAGQEAGVEIWRIEDFKPVPYPKDQYGKFYEGDSYIILVTKILKSGAKQWDIHFWLGSKTSQDESGAAAILSVQLDDQLGGGPVQHREVQEHESQLFASNFKQGIRYLPGGIQSGFKHVDSDAFETRLFQVKGTRNVRVKEVTPKISSMNKGDCFILDVGKTIYVYVGHSSKRIERLKAIQAANSIRDQDHAGKAHVLIVDEYGTQKDYEEFFKNLGGGSAAEVADESSGGDDDKFEHTEERTATLYRISDASGNMKIDPVGQKPLQHSLLDSNDCFILDTVDSHIFVWIGKSCNNQEKSKGMTTAQNFLTTKNYPAWTHIQRIVEGAEPTAFTQYFRGWTGPRAVRRLVRDASTDEGWEARLLHAQIKGKTNKFNVEQIFDFEQDDLNSDDIMILDLGTKVYIWIGSGASVQEKSKCADLVKDYLRKLGREETPTVRVPQGEEDEKFIKQFRNWDEALWEKDIYEHAKVRLAESNKSVNL